MAIDPNFTKDPKNGSGAFNAANSNLSGGGAIQEIVVAGAGGALVARLRVKATGSTSAGMLRLFHYHALLGAWFLIDEQIVDLITQNATTKSFLWLKIFEGSGYVLQEGHKLGIATEKGEAFHVTAEWSGFQ